MVVVVSILALAGRVGGELIMGVTGGAGGDGA